MSEEEKDILFDIDMQLYNEFNDTIASMYDHLGEIYTLKDIEEVEKAEKEKEIKLLRGAIKELQKENEEYHRIKKELIRVNKKIYDVDTIDEFIKTIDKLQKELEEKTTILMAGADKVKQLEKENTELKEENIILEGNKIGYKLAIQELKEKIENEIKELEENEDFYREHDRMYEYEGKINLLKRLLVKE